MSRLSFSTLTDAMMVRLRQFKNGLGKPAHTTLDGSDWTPADWLQATVGELGEYANFRKKYQRGDISAEEFEKHAAKELADVACYLTVLAKRCLDIPGIPHPTGVDLDQAIIDKFNEISKRVDSTIFLTTMDTWIKLEKK